MLYTKVDKNISFVNRGVLVDNNYIISDLHIGYSEKFKTMTIEDEKSKIINKLVNTIKNNTIDELILNGDVFHEFGRPTDDAIELFETMNSRIKDMECDIVIIKGNHDNGIQNYATEHDIFKEYSFYQNKKKITVTHGHKSWSTYENSDLIILGHLHPVIKVNGVEWPTYLYGEIKNKDYLVLPAFSEYQDGVVISKDVRLNIEFPFIKNSDFKRMRPFIYDKNKNTVRKFPILEYSSSYFGI